MKYLMYISLLLFGMLGATSCTQQDETMEQVSSDIFTLKVNIDGIKKATRTTEGITPDVTEGVMSNLYILFYEQGGGGNQTPSFNCLEANLESTNWSKSFLKSTMGLAEDKIYDVYALANVPSDIAVQLVKTITRDGLTALTENLMTRTASVPNISFSTFTAGTFKLGELGTDNTYTISLSRTVARLDMLIDTTAVMANWTLTSVKVSNEPTSTKYFSDGTIIPGYSTEAKDVFLKGDKRYYYVYEENQSETIGLTFDLVSIDKSETRKYTTQVPVAISRNKVYTLQIELTENPVEPVIITCSMEDWTPIDIDVTIPNIYLDLPSDTVELSGTGYGRLNFKSNAKKIKVNWKENSGLLVNTLKGPSTDVVPVVDTLENYQIDFSMFSTVQDEMKNAITLSVGNLTKEVTVIKPKSTNYLSVEIQPIESYPDSVFIYDPDPNNEIKIELNLQSTNAITPWYRLSVWGRHDPDGSSHPNVGMQLNYGYLIHGITTLNMMEEFKKGYYTPGLYECRIYIGYSDVIGTPPIFRTQKFYIDKQN